MKSGLLGALVAFGAMLLPAVAGAQPAIGVNAFRGTGPHSQMGKGLADMIVVDLVNNKALKKCAGEVVELQKRDEILREQQRCRGNPAFDQSSCAREGMMLDPTAVVNGTVTTTENTVTWSIQMRDPITGKVIGGSKGSAPADSGALPNVSEKIADQLASQACNEGMDYTAMPRASPPKAGTR